MKKKIMGKDNINILILSVGTRNKIVQYFRKEFSSVGLIVATDMSELAPAVYEADKYYKVPRMTDSNYIDIIIDICKREKISAVLSLIDPELSLLAKHIADFKRIGVTVIGSSYELCELCLNKWEMYKWLVSHNYNCAKTYIDKDEFFKDIDNGIISYPVFVKPICGSASIAISKVEDRETINLLFSHNDNLLIQEFLNGQEIGADVYIDLISRKVVSIFTKKKLLMRAGETDKAVSFKDQKLFNVIKQFVEEAGFLGQIDIDIFDIDGNYYISEVNPRFGGGYPHAFECGCNHIRMIKNNLTNSINSNCVGNYESDLYMMKYNELMIKKK